MMHAVIDYGGGGKAEIGGNFTADQAIREFCKHANEMFGIRKSIMRTDMQSCETVDDFPDPWRHMNDVAFVLKHNCGSSAWAVEDVAVWNSEGEKIKSEWD